MIPKSKNIIKKTLKQKHGITLIALVITIIVLLILTGVTIATLTGDNRIINKSGRCKIAIRNCRRKRYNFYICYSSTSRK